MKSWKPRVIDHLLLAIERHIAWLKDYRSGRYEYIQPIADNQQLTPFDELAEEHQDWIRSTLPLPLGELESNVGLPPNLPDKLQEAERQIDRLSLIGASLYLVWSPVATVQRCDELVNCIPLTEDQFTARQLRRARNAVKLARYVEAARSQWLKRRDEILDWAIKGALLEYALWDQFQNPAAVDLFINIIGGIDAGIVAPMLRVRTPKIRIRPSARRTVRGGAPPAKPKTAPSKAVDEPAVAAKRGVAPRALPANARISSVGRGIRGHQVVDRIAGEAEGALSQANRILESGGANHRWSQIYQRYRGSGDFREFIARRNALHQEAEQLLLENPYVREAQRAGYIIEFNRGSRLGARSARGNLLRPDIQIGTPGGRYGIIDWTTEGSAGKIFKYGDPADAPWLINVTIP